MRLKASRMDSNMKLNVNNKYIVALWQVLLLLILCFPRILQVPKIGVIALIVLLSLTTTKRMLIGKYSWYFTLLKIAYVILVICVGAFFHNSRVALINTIRVGIINSFIFLALVSIVRRQDDIIRKTLIVVILCNIYLGIYNLLLTIGSYAGLDVSFLKLFDATSGVGFHTGYSHIISTNLSMSIMTFPLVLFLINYEYLNESVPKRVIVFSEIVCGLAMILSGRRVLWLCLGISLMLFLVKEINNLKRFIRNITIFILVLAVFIYFADRTDIISSQGVLSRFFNAFFSESGNKTIRGIQSDYLLTGFWEHPLFGSGAGATIDGYIRSTTAPWSFELSYHVVLFQSGIVGGIIYFSGLCVILISIIKTRKIDRKLYFSLLVTYILILFANATNPYFSSSFDFMIFLYLPLMFSETLLIEKTYY